MNLSRAITMGEDMAISIGRFTLDSKNCRDNVLLIPYQLLLLILSGHIVTVTLVDYIILKSHTK